MSLPHSQATLSWRYVLMFVLLSLLMVGNGLVFGLTTAHAQDGTALKHIEAEEVTLADFEATGSFSNEYLEVQVNDRGQFVILTTGGDPDVEGDENKVLLYPYPIYESPANDADIWSSYTTFRRRTDNGGHRYTPTHHWEVHPRTSTRFSSESATTRWELGRCSVTVVQTLSFMTNPFTNRKDMVKIRYLIDYEPDTGVPSCPLLPRPHTLGVRLLLDTMIGDNDYAPFFIPGIGHSALQHDLQGDAIPPWFRVFESPDFAPDSLQAMGYFLGLAETSSLLAPSRFVIANWGDAYAPPPLNPPMPWDPGNSSVWEIPVTEGLPHGDSAVAIYWTGIDQWLDVWAFGYGLARQGGGTHWEDAPQTVGDDSTFGSVIWINNTGDRPYTGGTSSIYLPGGMKVIYNPRAAGTNDEVYTQPIGDVQPGEVAQVSWQVEVTGGPGTYEYTTVAEFTSGERFTTTNQVVVQETVGFEQSGYTVSEDAGAATITIQRINLGDGPITVDYSTADGTATANSDYTPLSGTLTFAAGEESQLLSIPIVDDDEQEQVETIVLTLTNPTGGAAILERGEVTLTIVDDDAIQEPTPVFLPLLQAD